MTNYLEIQSNTKTTLQDRGDKNMIQSEHNLT
jgi:hypothetical protein